MATEPEVSTPLIPNTAIGQDRETVVLVTSVTFINVTTSRFQRGFPIIFLFSFLLSSSQLTSLSLLRDF